MTNSNVKTTPAPQLEKTPSACLMAATAAGFVATLFLMKHDGDQKSESKPFFTEVARTVSTHFIAGAIAGKSFLKIFGQNAAPRALRH